MDAEPVILPIPIELLLELLKFFSVSLEAVIRYEKTRTLNCALISRDDGMCNR
jgi:hypothetical protein